MDRPDRARVRPGICLLVAALMAPLCACSGLTVDVGSGPDSFPRPGESRPRDPGPGGRYSRLPRRASFSPRTSVELREGCYVGDFVLGRSQIRVQGAGVDKTVIHGNLVLQTQCTVSNLTVLGDVIFEGDQAELEHAEFFGRIIDKGVQNRY
jgi:hypothetical protein